MRSAKISEMRAWYWKEQWADFRFWAPYMPWGLDAPPDESYSAHHADTTDNDMIKFKRISSRPVKWFYESHYTNSGEYAGIEAPRFQQRRPLRHLIWPMVMKPSVKIRKTQPRARVFKVLQEE